MKKWYFCVFVFLQFHASGAAMADTAIVNPHWFELSGLVSFDSYANNYRVSSQFEIGANWFRFLNTALGVDFEYRNFSVKSIETMFASYRFFLGRHEIRPGVSGGVSLLRVGNYSDNSPVAGLQGAYSYNVSRSISLRAEIKACWFFEDHTVFGTKVLLGMCWSFY